MYFLKRSLQPGEKKPYITQRAHGEHPIGSPCFASRPHCDVLRLEFDNGDVVDTHGHAAGLEEVEELPAELALAY